MNQTKLESLIERFADMGTGFIISVLVYHFYILPSVRVMSAFEVVGIFTSISLVRGYFWRRFFNRGLHKAVHNLVRKIYANRKRT